MGCYNQDQVFVDGSEVMKRMQEGSLLLESCGRGVAAVSQICEMARNCQCNQESWQCMPERTDPENELTRQNSYQLL